jgi:hypothetical protein
MRDTLKLTIFRLQFRNFNEQETPHLNVIYFWKNKNICSPIPGFPRFPMKHFSRNHSEQLNQSYLPVKYLFVDFALTKFS